MDNLYRKVLSLASSCTQHHGWGSHSFQRSEYVYIVYTVRLGYKISYSSIE